MSDDWQLEENTDRWLLEDSSGVWLLEEDTGGVVDSPMPYLGGGYYPTEG